MRIKYTISNVYVYTMHACAVMCVVCVCQLHTVVIILQSFILIKNCHLHGQRMHDLLAGPLL